MERGRCPGREIPVPREQRVGLLDPVADVEGEHRNAPVGQDRGEQIGLRGHLHPETVQELTHGNDGTC